MSLGRCMSFLAGSAAADAGGFIAVAVGAVAGASLRLILHRRLPARVPDASSRRVWVTESVLAFGLGVLAGVVLASGSGPALSPPEWGVLAALAAFAGTAFAVSWMSQEDPNHAPVLPAAHLLVTLFASLAGAAAALVVAGQF